MHFNIKKKIHKHMIRNSQSGDQVSVAWQHFALILIKMDRIIKDPHILSVGIPGEVIGEMVQLYNTILEGTASHLCLHAA